MRIKVVSKKTFEDVMRSKMIADFNVEDLCSPESSPKEYFISINDSHGPMSRSWFRHDHKNVLRLYFDDLVPTDPVLTDPIHKDTLKLFDISQAKKIVEFMKQFTWDSSLLVHCAAGVSRSGAVGTFVARRMQVDGEDFTSERELAPNYYVLELLNFAWGKNK